MTGKIKKMRLFVVLIITVILSGSALLRAEVTGAKILDDYLKATGGKAAYEKIRTIIGKSTVEMPTTGIKFDMTLYQARPNLFYSITQSAVTGKMENGFDGNIVWELSQLQGPQIKEGEERVFQINMNRMDFVYNWRNILKEARLEGEETISGEPCYKVGLVFKEGPVMTNYYSRKTKLVVRTKFTMEHPMGTINMELNNTEHKKYGDIIMPSKTNMKMQGMEVVVTVDDVKFNEEIPKDRFKLPAEIQALVDKKEKK